MRGDPSDAELAALTVVVAGLASTRAAEPVEARSAWADPVHRLRAPLRPGPGAWRTSAR
ncbi:MAG: acyl-CoA carboxylase subunit epsilon [Pseudonocardiaceae bacterium]